MLMAILRFIKVTIIKPFIEDCLPFLLLILLGAFYAAYLMEYWGTLMLLSIFLVFYVCEKILKWLDK